MDGIGIQLLVLAVSALSSAVGALVYRKIGEVSESVHDLVKRVTAHGESLSEGRRRFDDMERRIAELERETRTLLTEGCARSRACELGE